MRSPLDILDSVLIIIIGLAIASSCISNLRITQEGVFITTLGGTPFLYEMWIFFAIIVLVIEIVFGKKLFLNNTKLRALMGIGLLYIPIFLNALLKGYTPSLFIGGGQLRLQLEAILFCLIVMLGLSNVNLIKRAVKFVMTVTILLTLINVTFAALNYYGLIDPIYVRAFREPGRLRYSGLFDYPSRLGALCAIAFSWVIAYPVKKLIKWLIMLISIAGTFYADSRTGMAAIVFSVVINVLLYVRKKSLRLPIVSFLSIAGLVLIWSEPQVLFESQQGRIDRIMKALLEIAKNPLGVGWAEQAIFPHNWPIMVLLTGGVISFMAVIIYHIWLWRLIWKKDLGRGLIPSSIIVLATITIASYFEQIFLEAHVILIAMFLFGILINYKEDLTKKELQENKTLKSAPRSLNKLWLK